MIVKDYYSLPYVSNSALKWFKQSPLYCHKRMTNEIDQLDKSYMDFGRQVHMSILEPEEFDKNYTVLDFNKPTSKQQLGFCEDYIKYLKTESAYSIDEGETLSNEASLVYAYKDNYTTEKMNSSNILKNSERLRTELNQYINYLLVRDKVKDVLSNNKFNLIQTIKNTLFNHKKANRLFSIETTRIPYVDVFNELPIVWASPVTVDGETLMCKSLVDRLIINHASKEITLIDLKTTFSYEEFLKSHNEFDYTHQLAFYWLAVRSYFSDKYPNENFEDYKLNTFLVVVTTQPDLVECRVIEIPHEKLQEKHYDILKELLQISWHVFTDQWEHTKEYYLGDGIEHIKDEEYRCR